MEYNSGYNKVNSLRLWKIFPPSPSATPNPPTLQIYIQPKGTRAGTIEQKDSFSPRHAFQWAVVIVDGINHGG
jgi:hypothetical protein